MRNTKYLIDWKTIQIMDTLFNRILDSIGKEFYKTRDLWLKKDIGNTRKRLKATISAQEVLCLKLFK